MGDLAVPGSPIFTPRTGGPPLFSSPIRTRHNWLDGVIDHPEPGRPCLAGNPVDPAGGVGAQPRGRTSASAGSPPSPGSRGSPGQTRHRRLNRYAQLYSRVGFVHEFRSLNAVEVRRFLQDHWSPRGVALPTASSFDAEVVTAIIRVTGGNFQLLHRLLAQIARILEINALAQVTCAVVEAARESLVIGQV